MRISGYMESVGPRPDYQEMSVIIVEFDIMGY